MSNTEKELKIIIKELEMKKLKSYQEYQEYEKKINEAKNNLQNMCKHIWEIDRGVFDICRTIYTCKKCGI